MEERKGFYYVSIILTLTFIVVHCIEKLELLRQVRYQAGAWERG